MGPWAGVQVGVELLLLVLEGLIVERGVVELLLVELVEGVEVEEVLLIKQQEIQEQVKVDQV